MHAQRDSIRLTLFIIMSFLTTTTTMAALTHEWQAIGRKHVSLSSKETVIYIYEKDRHTIWRNVRLHVLKGSLKIQRVKLLMGDDQVVILDIQKQIKSGDYSRILKVPGRGRTIKKVTIYHQFPSDHAPDIALMAEQRSITDRP